MPVFQAETKLVGSAASYDDPYGGAGLADLPANFTCPAWQTSEPDDEDDNPTVSVPSAFVRYSLQQGCPDRGPRAQIWAPDRLILGPLGLKYMH